MKIYGLLGYPLGHSFSKSFFTEKFERENIDAATYENFQFPDIVSAVEHLQSLNDLRGFNITIPYKEKILSFLHAVSPLCNEIHSCNCVKVNGGLWKGFNTDVAGFERSLKPLLKQHHSHALIFGTGGASKAVKYVLERLGITYKMVSRFKGNDNFIYTDITSRILDKYTLLINTTPVGTTPHQDQYLPIAYEGISSRHLVYDLIYNPAETLFLQKAKMHGATTKNGLEMLQIQAEESWKIWQEDYSD